MTQQVPAGYCILGETDIAPAGYTFTGNRLVARPAWSDIIGNPSYSHTATSTGQKIYMFSASMSQEYDPDTDTISDISAPPTPRNGAVAGAVDGIVYLIGGTPVGGGAATDRNEAYDPNTNTWSAKADCQRAIVGGAKAITFKGKIYVFYLVFCQVYDPAGDVWVEKNNTPFDINSAVPVVVRGRLHVITHSGTHYLYRKNSDTWTEITALPNPRDVGADGQFGAAGIDGKIYIAGGKDANGNPVLWTDVYHPVDDAWSRVEAIPQDISVYESCEANNKLFIFGSGASLADLTHFVLDPSPDFYVHKAVS